MGQEFDAQTDNWIDIAHGIGRHGVVVIRRALDPTHIAALLAETRAEYARRDAQLAMGTLPPEKRGMHEKFRAIGVDEIAAGGVAAPNLLLSPLVIAIATLFLKRAPGIGFSSFRCARANAGNLVLPYHQDSRIIAVLAPHLGPQPTLMNVWVPLEDCGVSRPGLEVVNRPLAELMDTRGHASSYYASIGTEIDADAVERRFGTEDLWHPSCSVGDLMLFKGTTIHRTFVTPAMTAERISADIRLL